MLGRYRQPLPMSVLLFVSDVDGEALASSPLARSLAAQTDTGWTLDPTARAPLASVLVDHTSRLDTHTVAELRQVLDGDPTVAAVIGDAIVDDHRRLRPAWSPTALAADPTELDLVATRTAMADGSLASRIDALAMLEPASVAHVPAPLLRRSAVDDGDNGDAGSRAAHRLLADRRRFERATAATFLIPTAGTRHADGHRLVERAIAAAEGSGLDTLEILLIVGDEFDGDPAELERPGVRLVDRNSPWNFSVAINVGLLEAAHETVVLLNDDVEMLDGAWAPPLLDHLRDPGVALVGCALLYPDHTVQHVGVVIDDAQPLHAHVGARLSDLPGRIRAPHEVAAVTAACATGRRADLLAVGGFDESLPANFNDVDLCFKLQREIGRVVVDPTSPLIHHESASRQPVIEGWEWERFVGRWGEVVDPWYHPGHHRPDDAGERRRNADHLPPDDPDGTWELRTSAVHPHVHRARL